MTDRYAEANRALWNEWTGIHQRSAFYDLEGFKRGGVRLREDELAEVGDAAGKDLLHLQCHFGIDTLSWARLGATVTGVDFSEEAISLARSLADELGLEATFVHADVLDLPRDLDGRFDIVYTSRGVLGWLRDLRAWADGIARALRPGGTFYIRDINPVIWVFDDDDDATVVRMRYPYFERPDPLEFEVQGSYADRSAEVQADREFAWLHGLGDVVTAIAEVGLRVEFLHEHPFLDWELPFLERRGEVWVYQGPGELPLMFSLKATKPAAG
jgi:SAM-dependent methyltransferase